jgi:WD40 repeat protein
LTLFFVYFSDLTLVIFQHRYFEKKKVITTYKVPHTIGYSLAINPINKMILCGGMNGSVNLFHLSSKDALASFPAQADAVVSIQSHPDGSEILTAGQEGSVRLWDSANIGMCYQTVVAHFNQHKNTPL